MGEERGSAEGGDLELALRGEELRVERGAVGELRQQPRILLLTLTHLLLQLAQLGTSFS